MKLAEAFKMGEVLLDGLVLIEKMTNEGDGAIGTVRAALRALLDGVDGSQTPQEILARIEALHTDLRANDAAADQHLRDKFKP